MKRALAVAAVTIGLLGGGVAVAAPSQAAPRSWMTKAEFRWIYVSEVVGDSYTAIRRNTGSRGKLGYASSWYEEGYCNRYDYNYISCVDWKPGVTHTYRTYYWRTSSRAKYGASVSFSDGKAVSKSYYR